MPDGDLRSVAFRARSRRRRSLKNLLPYAPLAYSILTAIVLVDGASAGRCFRFLRRLSQERAALYIEQKQPKLRNNLINSLQLYPQVVGAENAQAFHPAWCWRSCARPENRSPACKVDDLLDKRRLITSLRLLGFLIVPVAAMVLLILHGWAARSAY